MIAIRYPEPSDKDFWFSLDQHLALSEFEDKVQRKMGYILEIDGKPVGVLRFNLFWDEIPFCNLLCVNHDHHKNGYGKKIMAFWEMDMKHRGYDLLMTSTQVDESAQHFYRRLGFESSGSLLFNSPKYKQPMELIMVKEI